MNSTNSSSDNPGSEKEPEAFTLPAL